MDPLVLLSECVLATVLHPDTYSTLNQGWNFHDVILEVVVTG